jgi:RND superfamily putative drug exporter
MAGILTVSGFVQMSSTAPILALMLGLAVGLDYALFIVNRHRRQLQAGMDIDESIGRAVGTAGSAVLFAGLTVVIALAALSVVGIPFLTIMGIAAAATVVMAVLIAITLVPALLGFAGAKVLRRKDRVAPAGDEGVAVEPVTRQNRWSRLVTRRPVAVLVSGAVLLGVLAVPAFSLRLGLPDDGTAAPGTTQRQAYEEIAQSFGPGANGPLIVTVSPDHPAGLQGAMAATAATISRMDGVLVATPAGASGDGTLGVIQVIPTTGPGEAATEKLVHTIRDAAAGLARSTGAEIAVTGQTALQIDVSEKLFDALPVYLAIVIGLALILLLVVFRSLLVPLKAAVGFLLTIAVSFGLVVAVYQWGWLSGLFGVDTPAPVISFLPILLIGVLFGLAMDYEVFLVSGMREAWVHRGSATGDATASVQQGFSAGSRVVTAAAIIMASVFCGFIMAPDSIIASIGFALGMGVLVDAFVVRMTLVPAVMTLLGRRAWYLPRWLDRILPNVDIEGAALQPPAPPERKLAGV